jgi:hypothetical protein
MSVVIGFSTRPANPLSMLIRKMTGAKCSHAWLLVNEDFFGRPMVMEATEWGVRLVDADIFWKRNKVVRIYKPNVDLLPAVRTSGDVIGGIYDFWGLLGMGFVTVIARWLHKKITNPLQSPHSLFCSELIMQILRKGKHPNAEMFDPGTTSPQMIYVFLADQKSACIDNPEKPGICFSL